MVDGGTLLEVDGILVGELCGVGEEVLRRLGLLLVLGQVHDFVVGLEFLLVQSGLEPLLAGPLALDSVLGRLGMRDVVRVDQSPNESLLAALGFKLLRLRNGVLEVRILQEGIRQKLNVVDWLLKDSVLALLAVRVLSWHLLRGLGLVVQ